MFVGVGFFSVATHPSIPLFALHLCLSVCAVCVVFTGQIDPTGTESWNILVTYSRTVWKSGTPGDRRGKIFAMKWNRNIRETG